MTEPDQTPLAGYELLVCVCGGIAAYKIATVVSALVQQGCGVSVAMTRNARRFIGPLTFEALTGRAVVSNPWKSQGECGIQHLKLTERADLLLVAPATANMLGKLANGIADDLISSMLLGADCPVLLAAAMNSRMWDHPSVQRNVGLLRETSVTLLEPQSGWLACRTVGPGRLAEAADLIDKVRERLLSGPSRNAEPG